MNTTKEQFEKEYEEWLTTNSGKLAMRVIDLGLEQFEKEYDEWLNTDSGKLAMKVIEDAEAFRMLAGQWYFAGAKHGVDLSREILREGASK